MPKKFIEIEHPGIMLKEDFLDDLGIKPGTFARAIGVDRTAVKILLMGKGRLRLTWYCALAGILI